MLRSSTISRVAALGSEKPVSHFSEKILRLKPATRYYEHPAYVLAREKLLNKMWREHLVFKASVYTALPLFVVANFFQA